MKIQSSTCTSNRFGYEGKLNVTLRKGKRKHIFEFHNEGTKYLFDAITRALVGKSVSGSIPKYFDIVYGEDNDVELQSSCLLNPIPLTGIVYGDPANAGPSDGRLLMNAIVTCDDKRLISTLINPRLVIKDDNFRPLAIISSDSIQTLWDSIDDGAEALIEWTMIFSNK